MHRYQTEVIPLRTMHAPDKRSAVQRA
jgi:hypothetical protein